MVNINRIGDHEHDLQKKPKKQLRGETRSKTVNDVRLNFNGSADAYVKHLASNGVENLPTKEAIRKAVSEVMNEEMVSTCWITNLFHSADSQKAHIKSSKKKNGIDGYVQQFEVKK